MKAHGKNHKRAVVEVARRYGFRFDRLTGNSHLRFVDPKGRIVITGAGGDPRALRNVEAQFRRLSRPG